MDEENGGGEQKNLQEKGQQVANDVQQTAQGVKDAANLAKNAATSNWLGVAKDTLNLKKSKTFMKKVLIAALASILLPVLIWYAIITGVGSVISEVWQSITSFFSMPSDGAIEIDSNQIDLIINSLKDTGVAVEGLDLLGDVGVQNSLDPQQQEAYQDALRKYIKEFFEAQAVTETLDRNLGKEPNKTYGTVKIYRRAPGNLGQGGTTQQSKETITQLSYKEYEKMQEMATNGSSDISNYFSVDNNGYLVVPSFEGEIETTGELPDKGYEDVPWEITLEHIDYVNVISKYTTPMNFFLYLNMISQNPEFVSAVADLVKDSEIRITVMYTTEVTKKTETNKYTPHIVSYQPNGNAIGDTFDMPLDDVTETTSKITRSQIPTVQLTYVKTWFYEESILYEKKETTNKQPESSQRITGEKKPTAQEVLDYGTDMEYIPEKSITTSEETTKVEYTKIAGGQAGSRLGEKGSQGILDKNGNDRVDTDEKVDENTRFLGLLDNKFRKPNSKVYETPGLNLVSGAETLFGLLQQDSKTQYLEQIMRYALHLYTGRDYGVEEYDFSTFKIEEFVNFGSGNTSGSYGGGSYGGGSYIGTVDIDGVPGIVYNFLLSKGVPPVGAAAIMGNIQRESSFDPANVYKNGASGLCQWYSQDRKNALKQLAIERGVDWTDVDLQLDFMWSELEDDYSDTRDVIMRSTDESDLEYATWYFARYYELAFSSSNNFEESRDESALRYGYAQEWYQKFKENSTSGFISTEGGAVYYQGDYSDVHWGSTTISASGCGPTAFAMVATDYTGRIITPREAVGWKGADKYYIRGRGADWDFFEAATEHFNLPCRVVRTEDIDTVVSQLRKGNLVISSQKKGLFTKKGHFILLYMDSNGGIRVRDPNRSNAIGLGYNDRVFTKEEIDRAAKGYFIFER